MKPDWTYIDGEDDIERFIEGAISELETLYPLESSFDDGENFEQISHTKFALTMLLDEIRKHRELSPYDIVWSFMQEMYDYSYKDCNPEVSHIFDVMYDTAQSILKEVSQ